MRQVIDKHWRGSSPDCGTALAPWLFDRGSLTLRIQRRCANFALRRVRSGLARISPDESELLGLMQHQLAYSREVYLLANDRPVVFAHSALAAKHLNGAWSAVRTLGDKPLGALLFAHPLVKREPLCFLALRDNHPLYRRAASVLEDRPPRLWARRSIFYLHDAPLLVTEVFLPEILLLGNSV